MCSVSRVCVHLVVLVLLVAALAMPIMGPAQAAPPAQGGIVSPQATAAATAQSPRPPDAVAGRVLYVQFCAACHGATGMADGAAATRLQFRPTTFADRKSIADKSPADLFAVAKTGRMERMMPPWDTRLTDQQLWDTIGYIWTLHTSAAEVDEGRDLYDANCAGCHRADGKGNAGAPDLTDFRLTSQASDDAWRQVVARGRGQMPGFEGELDVLQQQAALEYARSLSFAREFRAPLAAGSGVISGTITNGTSGQVIANLPVRLRIVDGTIAVEDRQMATDAQGFYQFDGLPTDANLSYMVTTQYPRGFTYGQRPAGFEGQSGLNVPITVYETTTDGAGIELAEAFFVVKFEGNQLLASEDYVFSMAGNRTYAGNGTGVLRFTLPPGAQGLAIKQEAASGRFKRTADSFVDTLPLAPGNQVRHVAFTYAVPYTGTMFDFVRILPYPAAVVGAVIADAGEQVTGQPLVNQGVRQTQSGNVIYLAGRNLPANQAVSLHFTNLPQVSTAATSQPAAPATSIASVGFGLAARLPLLLAGLVGACACALIAFPLMRDRRAASRRVAAPEQREKLVNALAHLEAAHQAGEIGDAAYRSQRLRLKAQMLDLMRQEERG